MKKLSIELMLQLQPRPNLVTISPDETVTQAARLLKQHEVGLLVVQVKDDLVGVVSERDVLRRWICGPSFPTDVRVGEIMSKQVETVSLNDTIRDCYLRFIARNCRHLPVLDPMGRVAGVLSLRDVANYVINRLDKGDE